VSATELVWICRVLGLPILIAFALAAEAVGIGGAQVFVGAGMGTGIGLLRKTVIRDVLDKSVPWFLVVRRRARSYLPVNGCFEVSRSEFCLSGEPSRFLGSSHWVGQSLGLATGIVPGWMLRN
jgi:hypothetical protein